MKKTISTLLALVFCLSLLPGGFMTARAEEPQPACTVTFDADGGSGTMESESVNAGESYTLPDCGFTAPTGKTFDAWSIGEETYKAGDAYTVNADTTVKAVWKDSEEPATDPVEPVPADSEDPTEPVEPVPADGEDPTEPVEPVPASDSEQFVDVPKDSWFHDPVYWAVDKGITDGIDDYHFSPDTTCTRAQMVTFLWRAAGQPAPSSTSTYFVDVDTSLYYADAVLWAVDKGITDGTDDTHFSPNDTVTRGQCVTFLWRYAEQPAPTSTENPFNDVTEKDYFYAPVLWAVEKGITDGTSDTTFSPKNDCLRSQVVTFLYRLIAQ